MGQKEAEASAFRQANGVALSEGERLMGFTRLFAYDLRTLGEVVDQVKGIYKIPIAYPGTFFKDGEEFSITSSDLYSIVDNFKKKGTGTINVDYEHASEIPELAKGGAVPASGWINRENGGLFVEPGDDGKPWLFGMVEWTSQAKQLIETKQYRFFSPAIDWAATDKETGKPQGATLTSSALTNRPFLEKLPPLLMTEVPRLFTKETTMPDDRRRRHDQARRNLLAGISAVKGSSVSARSWMAGVPISTSMPPGRGRGKRRSAN